MKEDFSYGIIPIYKKVSGAADYLFLLVQHSAGKFWSFPKGHKETGESEIEAARRELQEEAGISEVQIVKSMKFYEKYTWNNEGIIIDKTVTFFPGFVEAQSVAIDNDEVVDFGWFGYKEALEKLTYPETKKLLTEVKQWLDAI